MVIPGPDKPSLEKMNHLIELFVESMLQLEKGVSFRIDSHDDPEISHSHLYCNVSDLPFSHKASGLQGHNLKIFICPTCKKPFFLLSHPSCFDSKTFQYRDDWRYIKYLFCACTADPPTAKDISDNQGVHWSALNYLPGWMPAHSSVVEFMHAVFLTMVKHLNKTIILKSGLLNRIRHVKPIEKLEDFFSRLVWPLTTGKGFPKADQWHNQISIIFVALYDAWQHPSDAEIAHFSAAVCILSSQSISPDDVQRGSAALSHAIQSWAHMGCHLTPYYHFGMHFSEQMYEFGPCYATWAFAFEWHNGRLVRVNHNQHKEGELEATLMQ
ncbi:hypothetical protein F4604DRAFT_1880386 [Suillus subluteus]|nr:hypothetical protein F4604DRAFT_1880386 [Suillus subluteus]